MDAEGFATVLGAAQAGGEWALTRLYQWHDGAIRRYLVANAGHDGEDLAVQTWIDAARNLDDFRGDQDAFAGWLFTIARRRLIDHQRAQARRPVEPVDPMADAAVLEHRSRHDPARQIAERLAGDELARRVVDELPESQAEVILLRVVGGFDVAEVAELTGRRAGTVRVLQHRGLRRLAALLAPDESAARVEHAAGERDIDSVLETPGEEFEQSV